MNIKEIETYIKFFKTRLEKIKEETRFDNCDECSSDQTHHPIHSINSYDDFSTIESFIKKEIDLLQDKIKDKRAMRIDKKKNKVIKKLSKFKWKKEVINESKR